MARDMTRASHDDRPEDEEGRSVQPDGLTVRRLRHERAWGPRDLIAAISRASELAHGIPQTISPNLLAGIEDRNEHVPYATLRLLANGLDCDVSELLQEGKPPRRRARLPEEEDER